MKYPRYPAYRDSGIAWLGEIPYHWEATTVKRHFLVELGKMLNQSHQDGSGMTKPYLRAANIHWDRLELSDLNTMEFSDEQMDRYRLKSGDLLVTEGGVTVGRSAIWNGEVEECYYQNSLNRARLYPNSPLSTRFLLYWMHVTTHNGYVDLVAEKATFGHLTNEKLRNFPLVAPLSVTEQAAIVTFLDRETAKIDALIARQERLIAVLQEKRQALISHAVTKGLNPDAPMKESGVEWLGEVPENWQIGRFAYHLRQIETGWTPDSEQRLAQDDEWAVLKVGCVRNGQFFEDEHKALAPGVVVQPDLEVRPGDLLMSRANTLELVGSVGLIRKTRPHLTLSDKTFRLKLMPSMLPEYANYLLRSHAARSQIELQANGASQSMKNIGQDSIRRLVLPVPPVSEQTKIVHWLDDKACGLTEAIERVQGVVMALQERRTALISAAVTGKIDVRALTN